MQCEVRGKRREASAQLGRPSGSRGGEGGGGGEGEGEEEAGTCCARIGQPVAVSVARWPWNELRCRPGCVSLGAEQKKVGWQWAYGYGYGYGWYGYGYGYGGAGPISTCSQYLGTLPYSTLQDQSSNRECRYGRAVESMYCIYSVHACTDTYLLDVLCTQDKGIHTVSTCNLLTCSPPAAFSGLRLRIDSRYRSTYLLYLPTYLPLLYSALLYSALLCSALLCSALQWVR